MARILLPPDPAGLPPARDLSGNRCARTCTAADKTRGSACQALRLSKNHESPISGGLRVTIGLQTGQRASSALEVPSTTRRHGSGR